MTRRVTFDNKLITDIRYVIRHKITKEYLDGRNEYYSDPILTNRPPIEDEYLQWVIKPVNAGFFTIQSVSSQKYLDGRLPEHNQLLLTQRPPIDDQFLHWTIEILPKTDFNDINDYYAIKSRSGGRYIDVDNDNKTVKLNFKQASSEYDDFAWQFIPVEFPNYFHFNIQNNFSKKFLSSAEDILANSPSLSNSPSSWQIIQLENEDNLRYFALRNTANGGYLDGREENVKNPLFNHNDPSDNYYLHWSFTITNDGGIAIKSRSSQQYLDGRSSNNPQLLDRSPEGDLSLLWTFTPVQTNKYSSVKHNKAKENEKKTLVLAVDHNFSENFTYIIQSRSGNGYLDGRNPEHSDPLLTHREPINDHYLQWKIEPIDGKYFTIKSISGGGYLDGRNPEHSDPLLTHRNPIGDHYLHWEFEEVRDSDYLAIKSRSGGRYLDGRNSEHIDPLLTSRPAYSDVYLHWKISYIGKKKENKQVRNVKLELAVNSDDYNGDDIYIIQSRSGNGYLDGRNPEHSDPLLTHREPIDDHYLQWKIEPIDGKYFTIKSISGGGYLDGRNPEHFDPLLTHRNPIGDHYLHWEFEKVRDSDYLAIKSRSGRRYLDGRNEDYSDPLLTKRPAYSDIYLHWQIFSIVTSKENNDIKKNNVKKEMQLSYEPNLFGVGEIYIIQSRSGNGYLDGRNPEHSDPLLTHREPINDHYLQWKIEPIDGEYFTIQSISGGGYLDGRNPEHSDPLLTHRNPIGDRYLHWRFKKVRDSDYLVIKSRSGGRYLDGRDPEDIEPKLTPGPAYSDVNLHWQIFSIVTTEEENNDIKNNNGEKEMRLPDEPNNNNNEKEMRLSVKPNLYNGSEIYIIQSRSGNGYLDGRNPEHSDPLLTHREPINDHYLQWKIENIDGDYFTIKSLSGEGYLDGRNPEHSDPLLTHRNPIGDHYLHWKFESVDNSDYLAIKSRSGGRYLDGRNEDYSDPLLTNRPAYSDIYLHWQIFSIENKRQITSTEANYISKLSNQNKAINNNNNNKIEKTNGVFSFVTRGEFYLQNRSDGSFLNQNLHQGLFNENIPSSFIWAIEEIPYEENYFAIRSRNGNYLVNQNIDPLSDKSLHWSFDLISKENNVAFEHKFDEEDHFTVISIRNRNSDQLLGPSGQFSSAKNPPSISYQWNVIPFRFYPNIRYVIQSRSGKGYLDGRNADLSNPLLTHRNPISDLYLQWNIEEIRNEKGKNYYSIRSVSGRGFLDGRSPLHFDPLLTHRDPSSDIYLQWSFEIVKDGFLAIKSRSSGRYLDGRNPEHSDPLLTDRPPFSDGYLHWIIFPVPY